MGSGDRDARRAPASEVREAIDDRFGGSTRRENGVRSLLLLLLLALTAGGTVTAKGQAAGDGRIPGDSYLPRGPLEARLDSALRTEFPPERYGWLWKEADASDPGSCPGAVLEAVRRAVRRGRSVPVDRRYGWLLAADRRAARDCNHWFQMHGDTAREIRRRRRELADLGLEYGYVELGAEWIYRRSLMWEVWREAPVSRWGHFAFATLQEMGWDTSGSCARGEVQFERVVSKGERFLARREPGPFLRAVVETTVARAYETKWSISRTRADDLGIFGYPFGPDTPAERKERAAAAARALVDGDVRAARRRAVELYRSVASSPAAGAELRGYARAKARRLEEGKNTHQYHYYCVYD